MSTKILLIDDSATELEFARRTLGEAGYELLTRTSVDGVAELLSAVEIVLIDYHMPGADGGEVLRELRGAQGKGSGDGPLYYLYTSDKDVGTDYKELGFDGRIILKGNAEALVKQIEAIKRMTSLRKMRPR